MPHSVSPSEPSPPRPDEETLPDAPPAETTPEATENTDADPAESEASKDKLADLLFDDDDEEYPASSAPTASAPADPIP